MAKKAIRSAHFAGLLYPKDSELLLSEIDKQLAAHRCDENHMAPKAMLVPSSPYDDLCTVHASAFAALGGRNQHLQRILLIGACHQSYREHAYLPASQAFETPLGISHLNHDLWLELQSFDWIKVDDEPHNAEASLEIQLPFLQRLLGHVEILPILVGSLNPQQAGELFEMVWGGAETSIIIVSDLSNQSSEAQTFRTDQQTLEQICYLHANLNIHQLYRPQFINAFLNHARREGLSAEVVDYIATRLPSATNATGMAAILFEENLFSPKH